MRGGYYSVGMFNFFIYKKKVLFYLEKVFFYLEKGK